MSRHRSWWLYASAYCLVGLLALSAGGGALATESDAPLPNANAVADPDDLSQVEFDRRLRVQAQMPDFERLLLAKLVGFGGVFRDRAGVVVIASTPESIRRIRDG